MANKPKTDSAHRLAPALPYILIVGSVIGLIASFILSLDKLHLLENPNYQPSCDLNPIISCGSVMKSWQGSAFGFPNSWIGLIAFTTFGLIGLAMLANARFKRWFWIGLEAGFALGVTFTLWMLFESIYRIGALCPYCLTVDVVTLTMFWYVTLYNIREGHIPLPSRLIGVGDFARRFHFEILITTFLIITAIILQHFWYYYGRYL